MAVTTNIDSNPPKNTLIAEGLSKSYKSRPVVKNVSLQVDAGQIVGLLGPNGAG